MRLFEVIQLNEYNQQATLNKWGKRIAQAAEFNDEYLDDDWFDIYPKIEDGEEIIAREVIKELEAIDPTPNKQYVMTLVRWYTAVVNTHDKNQKLYAKLYKSELERRGDDWEPGDIWPEDYTDLGKGDYVEPSYVNDRALQDWDIEDADFDMYNMSGKSTFKLEDAEQIRDALEKFERIKPQLQPNERDIGRYKNFYRFEDFVDEAYDENYVPPETDNEILKRSDVEVLYNGPLGTVTVPRSHEASCKLGSGTKWCTTGKDSYYYDSYSSRGDLIIYNEKPGNAKYQFHVTLNGLEARDARDRIIPDQKRLEFKKHPVIGKILKAEEDKIFAIMAQQPWTTDAITNDGGDPIDLVRKFIKFNANHKGGVMRYVDEYYTVYALPSILDSRVTIPNREMVDLMLTYAKQRGKPWPEMMDLMIQILRKAADSADLSSNIELKSINRLVAQLDTMGSNSKLEQFKADMLAKIQKPIQEVGVSKYGQKGKPEWVDRAVQMKQDNPRISANQISKQLGVSMPNVLYWLTGKQPSAYRNMTARPKDSFPFKPEDFPQIGNLKYTDGAKPEWYDQALQMAKAGETFTAIAKKFGITISTVGDWLVKGRKISSTGRIVNPDAELEPRQIRGQKLDVKLLNSFIQDGYSDREIIELVADDKGPKIASQVRDMLPTLRKKLNPGTKVIDKTRSMRDPDITGLVQ